MRACLPAVILAGLAAPALAQLLVAPLGFENTPGGSSFLGPLASSTRTYQMLIHEDQLIALVGNELTGIAFRNTPTITTSWPPIEASYASFNIYLSPSVHPANRLLDFAANIAGPQLQVRSGALTIPQDSYTIGASPNAFGPTIEFNQSYPYAGGHLLIEIRHGESNTTSRSVDAIGTSNPGYLNQFSACWQGTTDVLQGNFAITQISFQPGNSCYANCDGSTVEPILNVEDFTCFISEFAQGQTVPPSQQITHYANCDGSTTEPVLNVEDFTCFISAFATGCP
jgi:hypothetical protein